MNPNFGAIIFGRTIGVADGHYGTLMLSKRFTHSWQLRGIYTFGKATDDTSSNDNGTNNGEAIFNPLNVPFQHGLADYNVAKRFTIDSVVEVPSGFFKNSFAKNVLGGWRMSNILVLQSGLPFSVFTSASFNPVLDPNGNVIGLQPGVATSTPTVMLTTCRTHRPPASYTRAAGAIFLKASLRHQLSPSPHSDNRAIWAETPSLAPVWPTSIQNSRR